MRITSLAPSITKPTYAVSSAPQGTFGASTPMIRSFAPAAAETQRSGGLQPSRRVLGGVALLTSVSLAGCGDIAANLAKSFEQKAVKPAETSLAGILTPPAGLNILESLVPNPIATGLGADLIATVQGSLAPNAGGTGTGGVSTVVDKVLSNTPSAAADSCPATTQSGMINLLKDNLLTPIPTNHLKPTPLTDCLLALKELDPGAAAPFQYKLQERLVLLRSADGGGASGGSSGGLCDTAAAWKAFMDKEVGKRDTLTREQQGLKEAGNTRVEDSVNAITRFTKEQVCPVVDALVPPPSKENLPAVLEALKVLGIRLDEELNK
jgi:hypothetical protein